MEKAKQLVNSLIRLREQADELELAIQTAKMELERVIDKQAKYSQGQYTVGYRYPGHVKRTDWDTLVAQEFKLSKASIKRLKAQYKRTYVQPAGIMLRKAPTAPKEGAKNE